MIAEILLMIQNKILGVKIKKDVILYDDPTQFLMVLILVVITFYFMANIFAFLLYRGKFIAKNYS